MSAFATLGKTVETDCLKTQSIEKIQNNIFDFLDGDDYVPKMIVGTKYNYAFGIALFNTNYVKVHRKGFKAKMKVWSRTVNEAEKTWCSRDTKDELQILLIYEGKKRKLIISKY